MNREIWSLTGRDDSFYRIGNSMTRKSIASTTLILLTFLTILLPSALLAERSARTLPAEVLWITDGDTIVIRLQGHKERVRLIGIDAPECRPNPKAQKDSIRTGDDLRTITEMGRRSTRYVQSILKPGDHVSVELDVQERDKYGRLLGYVWLQDGRMLNEEIVRDGYASLMTYPPNVKYRERFEKAYREAREAQKGLWGP
jgi:micrococcal nuclease